MPQLTEYAPIDWMTDDQVILFLVFWLRIPGSSELGDWKLEVVLHVQDFIFNNMQLSFHYFKIFFLWASTISHWLQLSLASDQNPALWLGLSQLWSRAMCASHNVSRHHTDIIIVPRFESEKILKFHQAKVSSTVPPHNLATIWHPI